MASDRDRTTPKLYLSEAEINQEELEAMEDKNMFDDNSSDPDWMSDDSSSADGDFDNYPPNKRLQEPTKYFQGLDSLESRVFENSMFQFYTGETISSSSGPKLLFRAGHGNNTAFRTLDETEIENFFREFLQLVNEALAETGLPPTGPHYAHDGLNVFDPMIRTVFHLIECRHIIHWVIRNIEIMDRESYCGEFISIIVVDKDRHNVASLIPIQRHTIEQVVTAFEVCLSRLMALDPSAILFSPDMAFPEATQACRNVLSGLDLDIPGGSCTELWRSAVHILDVAVLSYAGAHTQCLSTNGPRSFTLPGPFLEKQHVIFRKRSFLCLNGFLGNKEACVLERYHRDMPQLNLPPLYLSADATTFGDIWGPMWKTCSLQNGEVDSNQILRYSVGNGMIIPWTLDCSNLQYPIGCRKDEVFCHWKSENETSDVDDPGGPSSVSLHGSDRLLIGASSKLQYNLQCGLSKSVVKQHLRVTNSLFELGIMRKARILDSEAVQIQIGPPYIKGSLQRTYKRRGVNWKEAWTEDWKNNPESRNIKMLEFKFGVEVSACSLNARRRRFISLLGTRTMINHLKNGTLVWTSPECEKEFYNVLSSPDYKAFRKLYISRRDWQSDLGKAISHCIDALSLTGMTDDGLDLYWVPGSEPGHKVRLKVRDHGWIGFLKDTESCCTMAIFENQCLELLQPALGNKCQNPKHTSQSAIGFSSGQDIKNSVLETSFMLHQEAIPNEMRQKACHGHNGSTTNHTHVWSTSSLRVGERFNFGENGTLRYVESLGNGRILAQWKNPWDILNVVKEMVQGEKRHWEYIRTDKNGPRPVYVLIMSSEPSTLTSLFAALDMAPVQYRPHNYAWSNSRHARPRNLSDGINLIEIMERWIRGDSERVTVRDSAEWERMVEIIAALPSNGHENQSIRE